MSTDVIGIMSDTATADAEALVPCAPRGAAVEAGVKSAAHAGVAPSEHSTTRQATTAKHIRGSSLLLAGRVLSVGINFVVQVLTVRYLSKADYGAFSYALVLVTFLSSLTALGLDKAASRFVPLYHEEGRPARMFGAMLFCLITMLAMGLALTLLLLGLGGSLGRYVVDDSLTRSLLIVLIALAPVEALDRLFAKLVAVFCKPTAIFLRRHVVGPGLKLTAVLFLVVFEANVYFLAAAYVVAGALGVALYGHILLKTLRQQGLLDDFGWRRVEFPIKELLAFGIPVCGTDALWLLRGTVAVVLLGYFHSTAGVAALRAALVVAGMNKVVFESFQFLFLPYAARLLARNDRAGINDLYWQTSTWIAVLSYPSFVVSFALAGPVLTLLYGPRYEDSALVLAILSVGYFLNAALGFNAQTLKVFGRVRWMVAIDVSSFLALLGLHLLLIPPFGALGGAIATCSGLLLYNILNQLALLRIEGMQFFPRRYWSLYGTMLLGAAAAATLQSIVRPPWYVGVTCTAIIVLGVLRMNRQVLDASGTFPELLRSKLLKRIIGGRQEGTR